MYISVRFIISLFDSLSKDALEVPFYAAAKLAYTEGLPDPIFRSCYRTDTNGSKFASNRDNSPLSEWIACELRHHSALGD